MSPYSGNFSGFGLLRLSADDNVLVATGHITPGLVPINGGGTLQVNQAIAPGHKIASRAISNGEKIIKYGVPIGSATSDIERGTHVHVHNMKSDYTPTHVLHETESGNN